jgi:hypothetical protein
MFYLNFNVKEALDHRFMFYQNFPFFALRMRREETESASHWTMDDNLKKNNCIIVCVFSKFSIAHAQGGNGICKSLDVDDPLSRTTV